MDQQVTFGALNTLILIVYLAAMVWIGFVFAGKQKTTADFFLAGRNMPWLAVGMSVFTTVTSAVSYMGVPGLVYRENVTLFVGMLMMPVAAPFIILFFLPFYRRLHVTTSYEYVYRRFGPAARYCVSGLFVCARLGWLGTVVYAPALALSVVTTLPLWVAILLIGILATAYTVMGGLAAVIWTDVAQFLILVGGALLVSISLATSVPGGVSAIFELAGETGRLNLTEWRFNLLEMTMSAVLISYFFNFLHDYGVDQIAVQRLLATRSYGDMIRATLVNAFTTVGVFALLTFIGLGLFAYHTAWPERLPDGLEGDRIFPFYVVHALPQGVSGLVIAGVFAAAMSSLDSGINSVATVVINDFLKPLRRRPASEARDIALARMLTLLFGAFATGIAFFAASIGEIVKTSQTFLGLFSGPVLALFLLGVLTRRGSFPGWLAGVAVALPVTIAVQRFTDVHFVYYFPLSFLVSFVVGLIVSVVLSVYLQSPPADPRLTLRIWKRSAEPEPEVATSE
jgi:SSS family solute:Na+ symporter